MDKMGRIQFFYTPVNIGGIRIRPAYDSQNDFSCILTESDRQKIELNWRRAIERNKLWRGEIGSLVDTRQANLRYIKTDYGVWRAVASPDLPHEDVKLSDLAYDELRVSSVGIAVETTDGKVILTKKPYHVPAGGKLDSSANGFCEVKKGRIDFDQDACEKLDRELELKESQILKLELRGVHSVVGKNSFCNSGMFDYRAKTKLPFEEIRRRANRLYVEDLISVGEGDLPNFIVTNYTDGSLIGDGCATLLASLAHRDFIITVTELKNRGNIVEFGFLEDGKFVPTS